MKFIHRLFVTTAFLSIILAPISARASVDLDSIKKAFDGKYFKFTSSGEILKNVTEQIDIARHDRFGASETKSHWFHGIMISGDFYKTHDDILNPFKDTGFSTFCTVFLQANPKVVTEDMKLGGFYDYTYVVYNETKSEGILTDEATMNFFSTDPDHIISGKFRCVKGMGIDVLRAKNVRYNLGIPKNIVFVDTP